MISSNYRRLSPQTVVKWGPQANVTEKGPEPDSGPFSVTFACALLLLLLYELALNGDLDLIADD